MCHFRAMRTPMYSLAPCNLTRVLGRRLDHLITPRMVPNEKPSRDRRGQVTEELVDKLIAG